ncbi:MAG: hypothetical protein ACXIVE_03230 [Salinarimonas sp.]
MTTRSAPLAKLGFHTEIRSFCAVAPVLAVAMLGLAACLVLSRTLVLAF